MQDGNRVLEVDKWVDVDVLDAKYENRLFLRLVAKKKCFTNVDFKYSIFDGCHMRKCTFDSCDFTGCRFIGTNLDGSAFAGCNFEYVTFEKTHVDNDILDSGCPGYENLKMAFARTLRVNYQQIGDAISANKAMSVELEATELHLKKAWQSNESYYRKKYSAWKRAEAFLCWINFRLLDAIWGNGENSLKLLRAVLVLLFFMAIGDVLVHGEPSRFGSYLKALLQAPQVFLGVQTPPNYSTEYLTLILITRLVAIGFFMAILVKKLSRR